MIGRMHPGNTSENDTHMPVERRSGADRRSRSLPSFFARIRRRKSKGRRQTDQAGYVDCYDFNSWAVSIAVLALSLLDAFMTWIQICSGRASEANPIMRAVLQWGGVYSFYGTKAAMTALPLAILILHKEWRLARLAARLCLWSYILIALYHIYLVLI